MKKLNPLGHNVVIEKVSRRPWSIIETAVDFDYDNQWIVIAVWPGAEREDGKTAEMPVKIGDKVHFSSYDKQLIDLWSDGKFYVVNASKILAIETEVLETK